MEAVKKILVDIPLVAFRQLPLYPFRGDGNELVLLVGAKAHTWSRSARRKKLPTSQIPLLDPPLQYVIQAHMDKLELEIDWIRGRSADRALFEGFWGHISRKVTASLTI